MKEKSIWFNRMLKISLISVKKEGETVDDILKKLKKIKINNRIPSIFSKFDQNGKSVWLSNNRLRNFIFLAVDLGIFSGKNGKYFKSKEGELLYEKRKVTFEKLCQSALMRKYKIDMEVIIKAVREISPPSTAKKIARYLNLEMTKKEFNHFEVILQLYGDISDSFVWTGLISFGIPYKFHLYNQISDDLVEKITNISAKSKNKEELRKKIKDITNQDIIREQEITDISTDVYNKKTPNSSLDDLIRIARGYIEGKIGDDSAA